ncbi:ATP-binding protein [Actinomadura oligospora]|uniref:ATP-binding protein n=1 Tax=Actinomadura oligospora TaxID=111804 RepID=UPI0004AD6F9E|nr:ATP-binding protein [Actinomadura oligospora]
MSPSAPAPDPSLSSRPLSYALWTSAGATLALTSAGPWLFTGGARWPAWGVALAAALGTTVLAVLTAVRANARQARTARRVDELTAERAALLSERDALTTDRARLHEQWRQYSATLTDANGLLRKGVEQLLSDALPAVLADRDAPLPPPEQDEAFGADLTELRDRALEDLRATARDNDLSRRVAEREARYAREDAAEAAQAAEAAAEEAAQAAQQALDEAAAAAQKALDEAADATRAALAEAAEDADGRLDSQRMVLVALGRRQQTLMHRVQAAAERLAESRRDDPEVYAAGQVVDHLAAQAARLAQSLVVACGTWEGQHWPEPMRLAETVQAATARIEDFRRVRIEGDPPVAVRAAVLEPVIHLLAELLDNATTLSPSATDVIVGLSAGASGAVVRIDDQGTGLEEPRLSEAQRMVVGEQTIDLAELGEVPRLGLVVVGRYASRHGLHLALEPSPYGGLRVVIRVPDDLTTTVRAPGLEPRPAATPEPAPASVPPAPEPASAAAPAAPTVVEAAAARDDERPDEIRGLPKRTSRRRSGEAPRPASEPLAELAPPPSSPDEAGAFIASLFTEPEPGGETVPEDSESEDSAPADTAPDPSESSDLSDSTPHPTEADTSAETTEPSPGDDLDR